MNAAAFLRAATADMSAALFLLCCLHCTRLVTRVARLQKHLLEWH